MYGLKIHLNPSSIQEYVGVHRYSNFITMSNTGVDPLSNIRIMVSTHVIYYKITHPHTFQQIDFLQQQVDAPFNIKLNSEAFSVTNCSLNDVNCTITNLSPGQTISVNATIEGLTSSYIC